MGGSRQGSQQESRPLSGGERADIFNAGLSSIKSGLADTGMEYPMYTSPDAKTLTNQDYEALQKSLYDSSVAGLSKYEQEQRDAANESLADRGIWSSGIAQRTQNDITGELGSAYQKAAADATTQMYNLKSQEYQNLNANAMENANREYNAKWRPADYLSGIYNQTGGSISSGGSSGWSMNI